MAVSRSKLTLQSRAPPNIKLYNTRVSITSTAVSDRLVHLVDVPAILMHDRADGALIVLASFLLETKEQGIPLERADFPSWMQQHREIRSVLSRKTLD